MADLVPHFYCDRCSNCYHDEHHKELMYEHEVTTQLLDQISNDLPECDCGGNFRPGQSPKCPHCDHKLNKIDDPLANMKYPYVILTKGSKLFIRR
jgi:hypothetical protein